MIPFFAEQVHRRRPHRCSAKGAKGLLHDRRRLARLAHHGQVHIGGQQAAAGERGQAERGHLGFHPRFRSDLN